MPRGIKNVLKDNNGLTLFKYFKTKLSRIRIEIFGFLKTTILRITNYLHIDETANIPSAPSDGAGGVIYVKTTDGKPYYKSNEVSEECLLGINGTDGKFIHQASMGEATARCGIACNRRP